MGRLNFSSPVSDVAFSSNEKRKRRLVDLSDWMMVREKTTSSLPLIKL